MQQLLSNNMFVYALVFLAVFLPVALFRRSGDRYVGESGLPEAMPGVLRLLYDVSRTLEFPLGRPMASMMPATRDRLLLEIRTSSLPLTPESIFVMQVLLAAGGAVTGAVSLLFPELDLLYAVLISLFLAFIGWEYPLISLGNYVQMRQQELTRSLPFAIDLIGSAMHAGLEFGAAMRYFVGLGMGGPLEEEFSLVLRSVELGKTRSEALKEMAERVRLDAFTSFAGVVAYGTEIGASISDTLKVHGEELRRARFHLAERKAARAPSLMILPMAVFILPAVFIIIITPVMIQMGASGIGKH